MIRSVAVSALSALALAGCASIEYEGAPPVTSAPPAPSYPTPPPRSGVDPQIYLSAPRAPLVSELQVCSGRGSNVGPIGVRSESLIYTPYINTPAGALLRNPTEGACLSSGFGWRNAADGGGSNHTGLDLANPNGGFIFAAGDGVVEFTGWEGGYGLVVELDHGRGVHTRYAHLSDVSPLLSSGSFVHSGVAIARMGMTGNATGIHLHFEVSIDGLKVDPLNYGAPQVLEINQSHGAPIDGPPPTQTGDAAPPPAMMVTPKPDDSVIAAPFAPPPNAAPPQPPATAPLEVTSDSDGWAQPN